MLKTARVTDKDLVYDLGCGDGRIVIAAAKQYGARGVGIDIDPSASRKRGPTQPRPGSTDRVKFIQADLFETDLRPATVVTLYLLESLNLKLQPKLVTELKPGHADRLACVQHGAMDTRPGTDGERPARVPVDHSAKGRAATIGNHADRRVDVRCPAAARKRAGWRASSALRRRPSRCARCATGTTGSSSPAS